MNKKVSLGVTISAAAMAAAITFIVTLFFSLQHFNSQVQAVKEKAAKYERLEVLDTYVRENYYRVLEDEDEQSLMNGILKGYVAGLGDPYSGYYTPEEYQSLQQKESGVTVGIGVTAQPDEDERIEVVEVQENSPAEKAGIAVGDRIIRVGEEAVEELGYSEAVDKIRGEEGTQVVLTILHEGREIRKTITRQKFDVVTVRSQMLDNNIGYISIDGFRENTADQFQDALETLSANGAKALIFDVRNNGGGVLDALQKMLDPLLPEGVIATANYQDGTEKTIVYSDASELDMPMMVLVNGYTASAAELFSASLRDFGKAKLVGTQTFGKGIMQTTVSMTDGGGLSLTTATYKTTVSECYHGIGLTPDIVIEAEETDVFGDPETDAQLAAAIEALS